MLSHEIVRVLSFCGSYLSLYPFPVSLLFAGQILNFPIRLLKSFFVCSFCSSALIPLDVLPEGSLGPKPICFSLRMKTRLLCFSHHSLCFPQPTTSHPSPCSLRPQPWMPSTTFMVVHFRLEAQATDRLNFVNNRDSRSIPD